MVLAALAVAGLFGGGLVLDRVAAVEREAGGAAVKIAAAVMLTAGAYYLYTRAG